MIPVFQRNYRWEMQQWAKLWDSLTEIQDPGKHANHFMGFLVFMPELAQPGQYTRFSVIDGQQRLTSLSILLAAVRNVARQMGQAELADEVHQHYLVHPMKKGDQHYRLLPKDRDHDSYLALLSGHGKPTGRTAGALEYFEKQLLDHATDNPDRLRHVFNTVCQRFEFMCATLEKENAYNIFKSLNSTGVPLGPSDLIRNFVFMHIAPEEQDEFDRELWGHLESHFAGADGTLDEERFSQFFRDFLMAGGRYVPPKETFASFEARYEATGFSPKVLAQSLTENVRNYAVILGKKPDEDSLVTQELAGLNALGSATTYPLLLALFERRAVGEIDSAEIAQCIQMLRGFILRRFVCGKSSRGYGQMFVRSLNKRAGDQAETLQSYLLERGWPDDHQFKSAFIEFPLYERVYARELLETLERARGHREPADLQAAEIEHVLPQTLSTAWIDSLGAEAMRIQADWLHRPGNLTLSAYNQALWNHPFERKRERYAESNIVMTRELSVYGRWGEEEIRARGHHMADQAARIWIGPKVRELIPRSLTPTDCAPPDLTPTKQLQVDFWRGFREHLVAYSKLLKPTKPLPQHWMNIALGRSGFKLVAIASCYDSVGGSYTKNELRAELEIFDRRHGKDCFSKLLSVKEEIENEMGDALIWYNPDKARVCRIYVRRSATLHDEAAREDHYSWLLGKLEQLHGVFAKRVKDLKIPALATPG